VKFGGDQFAAGSDVVFWHLSEKVLSAATKPQR